MSVSLAGKRVAILVEDEFEDRELTGPLDALRAAGATVTLVGPTAGAEFKGKRGHAVVKSEVAAGAGPVEGLCPLAISPRHPPQRKRTRPTTGEPPRPAPGTHQTPAPGSRG